MKLNTFFATILCCLFLICCEKNTEINLPEVKTDQASEITDSSAKLNGRLIKLGTSPISSIGFEFAKDSTTVASEDGEQIQLSIDATMVPLDFYHIQNSLTTGTEYHFRTYAITTNGVAYGEIFSFSTQ